MRNARGHGEWSQSPDSDQILFFLPFSLMYDIFVCLDLRVWWFWFRLVGLAWVLVFYLICLFIVFLKGDSNSATT